MESKNDDIADVARKAAGLPPKGEDKKPDAVIADAIRKAAGLPPKEDSGDEQTQSPTDKK